MTNGAAALFMRTAYQTTAIYFGDTPLEPLRVLYRIDSAKGPGTRARRNQRSSPCSPVARRSTRTSDGSVTDPRTALRAKSWAGVLGRDLSPAPSTRPDPWVSAGDDHLEGLRVCRATERVVGIHDGLEGEPVAHEHLRCEFSLGDQFEQHGRGGGAHQASGDRDVLDPQVLKLQLDRCTVHTDIGHSPARTNDLGGHGRSAECRRPRSPRPGPGRRSGPSALPPRWPRHC